MNMRGKWITIVVAALLALSAAVVVAAPLAQGLIVDAEINYQGRLTDPDGVPYDGDFSMQFRLYDAQTLGNLLWDSGAMVVPVDDGLFNVKLPVDPAHADG